MSDIEARLVALEAAVFHAGRTELSVSDEQVVEAIVADLARRNNYGSSEDGQTAKQRRGLARAWVKNVRAAEATVAAALRPSAGAV